MSNKKKMSIEDIFNDDQFGLLDSTTKAPNIKTNDDRLVDSFEEINLFLDKNGREPSTSSMSEYGLLARLKSIRLNEQHKIILKPFDRHNLLGEVEMPKITIDDVLNDDEFGLLQTDDDLSIFKYKHIAKEDERADAEFIAQRKPLKDAEFKPYEEMFQKVHKELKEGKRKILPFNNIEKNLVVGNFYLIDGVMLYLKSAETKKIIQQVKSGNRERLDGRTFTIFENATYSNMLFRSLGKQIQKSGKLITNSVQDINEDFFTKYENVNTDDVETGSIYILKSKSVHPVISNIENLYKIGFSSNVKERIKNAKNEATYLFADVDLVYSYACYNRNADKLERLLHNFFADACLNIDIEIVEGKRISPREWFIVPVGEIEKAIQLIINEKIINYRYDKQLEVIVPR